MISTRLRRLPRQRDVVKQRIVDTEEDILRQLQKLARLKQELNSTALISQLPTEMLITIFLFYSSGPLYLSPILLAHVCHSWREISLGAPQLWSHISTAYEPEQIYYYLTHSGNAILTANVFCLHLSDDGQDASEDILDQLSRIGDISLSMYNVSEAQITQKSWARLSTPNLYRLELICSPEGSVTAQLGTGALVYHFL
ncbi:hypothetical protein C8Q75DRAFT_385349 [Abortiporus biennis]|nr:hypothetical protein C8Q75DRAFT_385349 [Abortiporus biennis]